MVNKSDKPVNGGQPPKRMREMFEERDYNVSYEHLAMKENAPKLHEKLEAYQNIQNQARKGSPIYNSAAENAALTEEDLANEMTRLERIYTPRYNESLASSIETYTKMSNINSRTTTMSGMSKFHRMAQSHKDRFLPTEMIEGRNQMLMEEANILGSSVAAGARNLSPDEDTSVLQQRSARISSIEEEIALNKRILKTQSRQGFSTEKLINRGEDLDRDVSEFLKKRGVESRVTGGNVGSFDDEMKKLGDIRSGRNSLQDQYNDAIEKGSEAAAEFAERLAKANDELEDQTRVVKTMAAKGMGGGGAGGMADFMMKASPYIMGAKVLANVADSANTMIGDQDITQMNNRAAFARMANNMYGKARNAVVNADIDSMLDVMGEAGAGYYSQRNKDLRNTTAAISSSIGLITNTAEQAGKGTMTGGRAGGIAGGINGFTTSLSGVTNVAYGNEGADSAIRSYEAFKNLSKEERAIRSRTMQVFYNQGLNSYKGVQGFGASASDIQNNLMSPGMLEGLAYAGVDLDKSVGLTSMLSYSGKVSGATAMNTVMKAGIHAQRGEMAAEDYMGAASRMIAMGGKNDDLEKIIESGTAKGMNNAKSINDLVQASVSMASGLASAGISSVGSNVKNLMSTSQAMVNNGVDVNLATGAAAGSATALSNAMSNKGFDIGNVFAMSSFKNSKNFGNLQAFQMTRLATLDLGTVNEVKSLVDSGDVSGLKKLGGRLGIGEEAFIKDGKVNKEAFAEFRKAITGKVLYNTLGYEGKGALEALESGKKFGQNTVAGLSMGGMQSESFYNLHANKLDVGVESPHTLKGVEQDKAAARAKVGDFKHGVDSAKQLGSGDAFQNIEKIMSQMATYADPKKFEEIAARSANYFEAPVKDFNDAVGVFNTAVNKMEARFAAMGEDRNFSAVPKVDWRYPPSTQKPAINQSSPKDKR